MPKSDNSETEPIAYSVSAAERTTGLGRTKIYELINSGQLESTKVGRRRLINGKSLRHLAKEGS